jgi:nitrite reductase/ring-hydroxylating ferredoxin subunit
LKKAGVVSRRTVDEQGSELLDYPPYNVLVAKVGARYVAIEDACNHAGASLFEGPISGDCVICPMHGYVFELMTGKLRSPKGLCADQRTFVVEVSGDELVIWDPFELKIT